jgi:hypothetical protein
MKNQNQYPHWPFPVVGEISPQTKKMISTPVKITAEAILKLRREKDKKRFDTDALL